MWYYKKIGLKFFSILLQIFKYCLQNIFSFSTKLAHCAMAVITKSAAIYVFSLKNVILIKTKGKHNLPKITHCAL